MDQSKTPLYDQLVLHQQKRPISLHVPGHKYGELLSHNKYSYFHDILKLDVTELTGLDDLHSPSGVIHKAEELLASLYGAEKSYFLVNGSTVGNLAMIMSVLKEHDLVLVQRNSHKSILNAIELTGASPIFIDPEFDDDWKVAGGLSYELIQTALDEYPHVKAIIVTYPNYYGMVNELADIIDLAHEKGIPVLVDEAHGAHFISGGCFPKSAVQLGADIVVQSAHKTLPAMTMGSYLHINGSLVSITAVEHYLHVLQSSSPSYPIMASLDIARSYLASYSKEDHLYLQESVNHFKDQLRQIDKIKVLDYDHQGDLLKLTLQSKNELNGYEMQTLLEGKGIYTEMADPCNVLLVFPLLKRGKEYPLDLIADKIKKSLTPVKKEEEKRMTVHYRPAISSLVIHQKERERWKIRKIPLLEAEGAIAAEQIVPYPPGIPLLFPGEEITSYVIEQIQALIETRANFQGNTGVNQGEISIFVKK